MNRSLFVLLQILELWVAEWLSLPATKWPILLFASWINNTSRSLRHPFQTPQRDQQHSSALSVSFSAPAFSFPKARSKPFLAQSKHALNVSSCYHCWLLSPMLVHALPSSWGSVSTGPTSKSWLKPNEKFASSKKEGSAYCYFPVPLAFPFLHLALHLSKWMQLGLLV